MKTLFRISFVMHPIVEQKSIVGGENYFWRPRHRRQRPRDQVCVNECMTQIIDIFERYDHQMACLSCSHGMFAGFLLSNFWNSWFGETEKLKLSKRKQNFQNGSNLLWL
jgi:hypothetical protein